MEDGVQYRATFLPLTENDRNATAPRGSDLGHARAPAERAAEGLRDAVARQAAASAEVLDWIGRCADEQVFRELGYRSESDWLSTELRISSGTAKIRVFLSRKLRELPAIGQAYRSGLLTWTSSGCSAGS